MSKNQNQTWREVWDCCLFLNKDFRYLHLHGRVLLGSQQLESNEYRQSLGSVYCLTKVKKMFVWYCPFPQLLETTQLFGTSLLPRDQCSGCTDLMSLHFCLPLLLTCPTILTLFTYLPISSSSYIPFLKLNLNLHICKHLSSSKKKNFYKKLK